MTISMAKFTLSFEEEYPYLVFGITATTKDYRMCWSLNKALNISLKRQSAVDIHDKEKGITGHSCFVYEDEMYSAKYRLIENKRAHSRFLPEVVQADYLLIVDETERISKTEILLKIKTIRQVLLAFNIDIDTLKHKQNLMLTA